MAVNVDANCKLPCVARAPYYYAKFAFKQFSTYSWRDYNYRYYRGYNKQLPTYAILRLNDNYNNNNTNNINNIFYSYNLYRNAFNSAAVVNVSSPNLCIGILIHTLVQRGYCRKVGRCGFGSTSCMRAAGDDHELDVW